MNIISITMNTKARKDTGTHGGAPLRIARFSFCHLLGRGRMLAAAATNRARKSNGVRLSAKSLADNTCQFGGHKRLGLPFNTQLRFHRGCFSFLAAAIGSSFPFLPRRYATKEEIHSAASRPRPCARRDRSRQKQCLDEETRPAVSRVENVRRPG